MVMIEEGKKKSQIYNVNMSLYKYSYGLNVLDFNYSMFL